MKEIPLKFGVVGWGEIGQRHAAWLEAAGAQLAGVVSARRDLELGVPIYSRFEDILPHINAVTIAVPNHLHAELCIQAIDAGKAVMVEKPICIQRRELSQLQARVALIRAPVCVGYRLRYNPEIRNFKSKLGSVKKLSCTYRMNIEQLAEAKDWTRSLTMTGGSFFTLGIHMLDLCRWLIDENSNPLPILYANASKNSSSADYPLDVTVSCESSNGIELMARADLSTTEEPGIEIAAEHRHVQGRSKTLRKQFPADDDDIEYPLLFAEFLHSVKTNQIERNYLNGVLATHGDLMKARELALLHNDKLSNIS